MRAFMQGTEGHEQRLDTSLALIDVPGGRAILQTTRKQSTQGLWHLKALRALQPQSILVFASDHLSTVTAVTCLQPGLTPRSGHSEKGL